LQAIKALGMKAGVAINPHTPIALLADIINDTDLVCMMSVNPGFGGQSFIPNTLNKIQDLKKLIVEKGATTLIEIDGGVTLENASGILAAGADVLVAGNTVFSAPNPSQMIADLQQLSK
jgi:ribulose-phosphate 3-epimerase